MSAKRLWQIGGFLVVVGILAFGWFVIISPGFATVDDNNAQRAAVIAKNAQIQADIAHLSKVDVTALEAQLAARIAQIPQDLVEEDVYDEIKTFGAQAGVAVTDIAITQASAFATNQQSSAGTDPSAPVAPGSPIGAPGLPITAADLAVANRAAMYDSPVSITVDGDFASVRRFIDILTKQSSRTFLVTGASMSAEGGSMSIDAVIWFKPRAVDLLSDPAASSPAPAPSAPPTTSPTPGDPASPSPSGSPTPQG